MIRSPFRYFKTSPEIIQLTVMMYIRFALSLRNIEDLLHERGIDVSCESIRLWADRFGNFFARMIRKRRAQGMRQITQWRWYLDEMFVKIAGETHSLWRTIDHEGEVLGAFVTKTRDKDVPTIPATGPAGYAMVFDGRLWHGTGANVGKGQRKGLLTTFCGPQFRPQENFTVGTRSEVLEAASEDLLGLLGFGVWCGYGRTGNPTVAYIDPAEEQPGVMRPT